MVTIIMPAYNCEKYLEEAVESVKAQTYRDWKLLIIDDCSKDGTFALARRLAESDERIRVFHNEVNSGVSKTRNRGIREADTEWIAFLDSDDVWVAEKLEKQLALADEATGIVYCSYDFINEAGEPIKKPFIVPAETNFRRMLTSSVISCSTALVRTSLMKKHFFDPTIFHEDYVLWMELLSIPCKAVGNTEVLAHYRQSSSAKNIRKGNAAKARWRIYRENLHLSLFTSVRVFLGYAVKGVIKYYF